MEISKTILSGSLILILIIGFVAGYFVGQSIIPVTQESPGLTGEIPIGVMLADTVDGAWDRPTSQIVEKEINDYLETCLLYTSPSPRDS